MDALSAVAGIASGLAAVVAAVVAVLTYRRDGRRR